MKSQFLPFIKMLKLGIPWEIKGSCFQDCRTSSGGLKNEYLTKSYKNSSFIKGE